MVVMVFFDKHQQLEVAKRTLFVKDMPVAESYAHPLNSDFLK